VRRHGATPQGVDWNSAASQALRFEQLSGLLPPSGFSLCDFGCGYGGYYDFLRERHAGFDYLGIDVSEEMVRRASELHAGQPARFVAAAQPPAPVDYVVASGIFNVRQETDDATWLRYVLGCIDAMAASSRKGFAFNCLTSYSDADKKRDYLYYADPKRMFDHCMGISRHVTLLHGYGLYEFTLLVRKEDTP
jgi:SAM-dependent methyltransferase